MAEIQDLKECIVLVTGGANGLGFAMTDHFIKNGAKKVIIVDVNEEKGVEAVRHFGEDKTEFKFCDVSNDNQIDELVKFVDEKYGGVQILVNNAGIVDENNYKRAIDINLTSVITMTLKFYESSNPPHTIINVSSIYGFRNEDGFVPVYQATKHGVAGFTKSIGHIDNFNHTKIRVLAICPGMTRTNMTAPENSKNSIRVGNEWKLPKVIENGEKMLWQQPDDIGRAIVQIYKRGASGSLWLAEGGNVEEVAA